ncbi:hypothetical protein [Litchfieldia salsa]|uniref:Uncharacterized protein n=1 Tax=Litchfieldia salsa TaxID=930152 RepID=A0A1H0TE62_9BACI|nr:hypothetical protein [Litchfieldia salsa]SDP52317.1 hypothetical protein SAMN05216565_103463 [Litchfieldia salsa]
MNRGLLELQHSKQTKKTLDLIDGPLFDLWLKKITNGLFTTCMVIAIPLFFYLFSWIF